MTHPDGSRHVDDGRPWRRWLQSIEAAAIAGIIFAVASSLSFAILFDLPGIEASDAEALAFYREPGAESQAIIALDLMVLAVIGFLWFMGVIRNRMGEQEPKLFSTVFFGGGVIIAAGLLLGVSTLAAPVSMMWGLGIALLLGVVPKIQALFVFSTSTLGLRTGILPRWLIVLSVIVGVGLLINITLFTASVYIFPIWVLAVSLVLLIRPRLPHRDDHWPRGSSLTKPRRRSSVTPRDQSCMAVRTNQDRV